MTSSVMLLRSNAALEPCRAHRCGKTSRSLCTDTISLPPMLQTHAVLAATECGRQGVDIYLFIACDALGRPHVYSPLWLVNVPGFWGVQATNWVGLSLDVLFILSLPVVLRPRTFRDILLPGLAALSPMTVYALERANN